MRKETKKLPFSYVFELISFAIAAEKSDHVGALGPFTVEELLRRLDYRCKVDLTEEELEHLVYTYKQTVMNKVDYKLLHTPLVNAPINYNGLLTKVAHAVPDLFVISQTGESKERE